MPDLPLWDIQGLIVRRYGMACLRVLPLRFEHTQSAAAARFLTSLTDHSAEPNLTDGAFTGRREYCLNIAFTYKGLEAIGLPEKALLSFPDEFRDGAAARAAHVGDTESSAPSEWDAVFKQHDQLHALMFLYATDDAPLTKIDRKLREGMAGGFSVLSRVYDSAKLADNRVHFGYRDGLAQPSIEGVGRSAAMTDVLPRAKAGDFLLGYRSQFENLTYPVPQPYHLGKNGSFVAFRRLCQDCDAFENFLDAAAEQTRLDRELIAAKLCGRWRNGMPLSLSPSDDRKDIAEKEWNSFDHANDPDGIRCPIGSHIRRMNPRRGEVAGATGLKRRIIRRGMPFGPPHKRGSPDNEERGLLGIFICASLKEQFEFLMSEWTNRGTFAAGLGDTRDPIHGNNANGKFYLPVEDGTFALTGLKRFVTCKGAAYCFLPSLTAIDHLAGVAATAHR